MPIIKQSTYANPPGMFLNGHFETIIPGILRKAEGVKYQRERIDTSDGDFLDLDCMTKQQVSGFPEMPNSTSFHSN